MAAYEPDRLLLILSEHGVDFIVIGGIAATAHGSRYMTDDVDVLFERSLENRQRLAKALHALAARLSTPPGIPRPATQRNTRWWQEQTQDALANIDAGFLSLWNSYHFETPFGPFDCMATVPGAPPYEEARQRANETPLEHCTIRIVDLDDLLAMKRATARPKDLATVTELLEIRRLLEQDADQPAQQDAD